MDNRMLFGFMCIFLNSYGVPCFMQGHVSAGVWRIVLGCVTFGVIAIINFVKGIILGVKVLKMTDEEYAEVKGTLANGVPLK